MPGDDDRTSEESDDRNINEEYKIWKMNVPFMYDTVITHTLEWPSLTVEWLPDREEPPGKDYSVQKMVLGTHTSGGEPNSLMVLRVQLPLDDEENEVLRYDVDRSFGGAGCRSGKVQIIKEINHEGEVNRARHMPHNPSVIATKTVGGEVHIFNYRKHRSKPLNRDVCPELRLMGHRSEGFGLAWSPVKMFHLLSGSDDSQICVWDINAPAKKKCLHALRSFKLHAGSVEDVAWHAKHEHVFGSVGDDYYLHLWDLRIPSPNKPTESVVAHQNQVNSLAFNPHNEWILATGSSDATIKLFDLRKISVALHTMYSNSEVFEVRWNPKNETILASCCLVRRLNVWDISRIGAEQTAKEAEDGPPELLFIHGGHTSRVLDFSWNPCMDWAMASVAEDNILQIWQMAETLYIDDYDEEVPAGS